MKSVPSKSAVAPSPTTTPPPPTALLPLTWPPSTVSVAPLMVTMPPPALAAVLSSTLALLSVSLGVSVATVEPL